MTDDPTVRRPERLVIRAEDLGQAQPQGGALPPPPPVPGSAARPGGVLPPVPSLPPTMQVAGGGMVKLGANSVVSGLLGGGVGGLLGAIVSELIYSPDDRSAITDSEIRFQTGVWVMIVGAVIGFVLLAWDGLTSGSPQKARRDGFFGAVAGGIAGFVGGYIAQIIFSDMLEDVTFDELENKAILARVIAWAVFGALLGIGLGIKGGQKKIVNGLIGGLLGGGVGGLLFQLLANSDDTGDSGTQLRIVGLVCTGVGIGLGIGLVERARRDSWLTITSGPMAGKEFILYNASTLIGSDYRCHIVLVRDPSVAAQHLSFDLAGGAASVRAMGGQVLVNGQTVQQQRLRNGDTVTVGASVLSYHERAATGGLG